MATKTLILRPIASKISVNGTYKPYPADVEKENFHVLIAEEEADDDATYLVSTSTPLGGFTFGTTELLTLELIQPFAARIVARMRTTVANSTAFIYYRGPDVNSSDSLTTKLLELEPVALTETYENFMWEIPPEHVSVFWDSLVKQSQPNASSTEYLISLAAGTTDTTTSSKNIEKEARFTQLYLEVDYDDGQGELLACVKINKSWLPIYTNTVYKKINGTWQISPQSMEVLSTKIQWDHYYLTFTELEDGTYSVRATDPAKLPDTVYVPKTHRGKLVTAVASNAFKGALSTQVILPDSLRSIGDAAFLECIRLSSISLPDSVTVLGDHAFEKCSSLTSIRLPSSLSRIPAWAFTECTSLSTLLIPDTVTQIGSNAFCDCQKLQNIDIPINVRSIGDSAFRHCKSFTAIKLPDNIEGLGRSSFEGCSSLTSVALGPTIHNIGSWAFNGCSSLTEIILPASLEQLGTAVFQGCDNLTIYCELDTPPSDWNLEWNIDNLTVIWNYNVTNTAYFNFTEQSDGTYAIAAKDITNMPSTIVLPATYLNKPVTAIEDSAFKNCSIITSIRIPTSIKSIGQNAFRACSNLITLTLPGSDVSLGQYMIYGCTRLTTLTIPEGITAIGSSALAYSALQEVTLPTSLVTIGDSAFSRASGLRSISIPGNVSQIGATAFSNCSQLSSVTLEEGITQIGGGAFEYCSNLTSIRLPASLTKIYATTLHPCGKLTAITVAEGNQYYKSIDGCLYSADGQTFVCYPEGKTNTSFELPDGVLTIGDNAFDNSSNLQTIVLSDSVLTIGARAFDYSGVTNISLGAGVTTIKDNAFNFCQFTSITLPRSLTTIGEWAFNYCNRLKSIVIPNSVTTIDELPFRGCSALTTIYCEAASKPSGWSDSWNSTGITVVWGYTSGGINHGGGSN